MMDKLKDCFLKKFLQFPALCFPESHIEGDESWTVKILDSRDILENFTDEGF